MFVKSFLDLGRQLPAQVYESELVRPYCYVRYHNEDYEAQEAIELEQGPSTWQTVSFGKYETVDLRQTLDHLDKHGMCDETVGVLGVGYGAYLALHWAARDARVRTVLAIAPYHQPEQAIERLGRAFCEACVHLLRLLGGKSRTYCPNCSGPCERIPGIEPVKPKKKSLLARLTQTLRLRLK